MRGVMQIFFIIVVVQTGSSPPEVEVIKILEGVKMISDHNMINI